MVLRDRPYRACARHPRQEILDDLGIHVGVCWIVGGRDSSFVGHGESSGESQNVHSTKSERGMQGGRVEEDERTLQEEINRLRAELEESHDPQRMQSIQEMISVCKAHLSGSIGMLTVVGI